MGKELPFNIIELDQRTEAWYVWRHDGIGASEASKIMGENRFDSADAVLHEKLGSAGNRASNFAMQRGEDCEPDALVEYKSETGYDLVSLCAESKKHPWMRASLDGITKDYSHAVEIKCGASAYRKAVQYGEIPEYYHAQLQHIMAVTGLESLDYWCWQPGCDGVLIPVRRNNAYIARLIHTEEVFWQKILKLRAK